MDADVIGVGTVPELGIIALRALLDSNGEFALLDVREEGVFNMGHALYAIPVPFSHLETRLPKLVPCKQTPVVLMDEGSGELARAACQRMQAWGYRQVSVLHGGLGAWQGAGRPVFSGVNVLGKAFGEFVEMHYHTPSIEARQLQAWMEGGEDVVILDVRPYAEFHVFSVPGAINCPGVELTHRAFDIVSNEDTAIVISCAGRTRGIIGAQSLVNAAIPNPVAVLKNGVQGWVLAGYSTERGNTRVAAPPGVQGLNRARLAATTVAQRCSVAEIDAGQLDEFRADDERTLYLFDVRTPEEYAAGHLPDFRSAPGGQLVQAIDHYVGTRNARIVLCDDTGVRAFMTASWLRQSGWQDVYVLQGGLAQPDTCLVHGGENGIVFVPVEQAVPDTDTMTVVQLAACFGQEDVQVLDLASSLAYRHAHIPGAWFVVRSRINECLRQLPPSKKLVLTSTDGVFARLASGDVAKAVEDRQVSCLQGGTTAWEAAGFALNKGFERMACSPDDVWYSPFDEPDPRAAMQAYLCWELGLMEQLKLEGAMPFKAVPIEG